VKQLTVTMCANTVQTGQDQTELLPKVFSTIFTDHSMCIWC